MLIFVAAGALAGMISMVVFAGVHALTISDIWWSLPMMAGAGAIVGSALAWSFRVMGNPMTPRRWLAFTGLHLGLLVGLAVASLLVFEPETTAALLFGVLGMQEADRLLGVALPFTAGFTVVASVLMTSLFGRAWWHFFPTMATMALVMATLGSNVVIIGLIDLDERAIPALTKFLGLTVLIVGTYSALMAVSLARSASRSRGVEDDPAVVPDGGPSRQSI